MVAVTASYSAACRIAKLRVGCTVAGCAPGVPRMAISSRFQSTTSCPEPGRKATADARWAAGRAAGAANADGTAPTAANAAAAVTTAAIAFRAVRMLGDPFQWGMAGRFGQAVMPGGCWPRAIY